jgi:phosphate uptake regulator
MGTVGDILAGIKQVILLQENVERLQQDVAALARDVGRIRDYTGDIDRRVARIEGVMEGYGRAASQRTSGSRQKKLPKE